MVEHIHDLDDARLADYRMVGDPDALKARSLFVAEGQLVVARLLQIPRFTVRSVLLSPAAHAWFGDAHPAGVDILLADQRVINSVTGFNFHRGCLAIVERPAEPGWSELSRGQFFLGVEGVGNPDNIGGLFRVAAAFGLDGVLLDPTSGDPLYRKAVRTSMGAALAVPFARASDLPSTLRDMRDRRARIIALTPRPSAMRLPDLPVPIAPPWIVLVGAEGHGLSATTLAAADLHVRIPTAPTVDSLNVTVAAGVVLATLRAAQMPDPSA